MFNLAHVARNKKVLKKKLKLTHASGHFVRYRLRSVTWRQSRRNQKDTDWGRLVPNARPPPRNTGFQRFVKVTFSKSF